MLRVVDLERALPGPQDAAGQKGRADEGAHGNLPGWAHSWANIGRFAPMGAGDQPRQQADGARVRACESRRECPQKGCQRYPVGIG